MEQKVIKMKQDPNETKLIKRGKYLTMIKRGKHYHLTIGQNIVTHELTKKQAEEEMLRFDSDTFFNSLIVIAETVHNNLQKLKQNEQEKN